MSFIAPSEQTSLFKYRDDHEICWSVTKGSPCWKNVQNHHPLTRNASRSLGFIHKEMETEGRGRWRPEEEGDGSEAWWFLGSHLVLLPPEKDGGPSRTQQIRPRLSPSLSVSDPDDLISFITKMMVTRPTTPVRPSHHSELPH